MVNKDKKNRSVSYPILDQVNNPNDLKFLEIGELEQLSSELRSDMIDSVSKTGGHLGAGLGVVELAIAIHYVFNTPDDRLIWDVGHQAYPHKILTSRRNKMNTLGNQRVFPDLQKDLSLFMILLVRGIHLLLFQQLWEWRLQEIN